MMKRLTFLLLAAALCASCSDDFLSPTPQASITVGNFYRTQEDIDKAVSGVYAGMATWPEDIYIFLSEVRSNNYMGVSVNAQRDWWDITTFNTQPENGTLRNVWGRLYQMINRANVVLEKIDGVQFRTPALKTQYIAETRFLRAMAYFELVRLFGNVPLVTQTITPEEATRLGQSPPAEIYAFIASEMSAVADQLPERYTGTSVGRLTRWAAKGLLARVYLTMAGYPLGQTDKLADAARLLKEVIDHEGQGYSLAPNYDDLFTEKNDNRYNLFEIQFVSGGNGAGSEFPMAIAPDNIATDIIPFRPQVSPGDLRISESLLNAYEPGDERFDATIDTSYATNTPGVRGNTPWIHKFVDPGTPVVNRDDWPINFPLLRYADVLLMYAEVLATQAGGPTAESVRLLNRVRERAGLAPIQPAGKAAWDAALRHERRIEFVGEGRWWFDLVRWGIAVEVMNEWFRETNQNIVIDQNDLLYPIPQSEIDIFPGLYQQNPGY